MFRMESYCSLLTSGSSIAGLCIPALLKAKSILPNSEITCFIVISTSFSFVTLQQIATAFCPFCPIALAYSIGSWTS